MLAEWRQQPGCTEEDCGDVFSTAGWLTHDHNLTACGWSPEQPLVLARFRDRTADFKEVCRITITYPLPAAQRWELSNTRLSSQKPTGRHDIIKLQYTDHKVHTASCNAAVVDFKASYGLSDRRGWRDCAADCCLPSTGHDYWKKYCVNTNTIQYQQVLANTQYPNTGIVQTPTGISPGNAQSTWIFLSIRNSLHRFFTLLSLCCYSTSSSFLDCSLKTTRLWYS